jgi:hypothetical protein
MSAKGKIAKLNARIKLLEGGDFYNKSQEALNSQARLIRELKSQVEKLQYWRGGLAMLTVLAMIAAGDNLVEFVMGVF